MRRLGQVQISVLLWVYLKNDEEWRYDDHAVMQNRTQTLAAVTALWGRGLLREREPGVMVLTETGGREADFYTKPANLAAMQMHRREAK